MAVGQRVRMLDGVIVDVEDVEGVGHGLDNRLHRGGRVVVNDWGGRFTVVKPPVGGTERSAVVVGGLAAQRDGNRPPVGRGEDGRAVVDTARVGTRRQRVGDAIGWNRENRRQIAANEGVAVDLNTIDQSIVDSSDRTVGIDRNVRIGDGSDGWPTRRTSGVTCRVGRFGHIQDIGRHKQASGGCSQFAGIKS